jgi:hypothetical protein
MRGKQEEEDVDAEREKVVEAERNDDGQLDSNDPFVTSQQLTCSASDSHSIDRVSHKLPARLRIAVIARQA